MAKNHTPFNTKAIWKRKKFGQYCEDCGREIEAEICDCGYNMGIPLLTQRTVEKQKLVLSL